MKNILVTITIFLSAILTSLARCEEKVLNIYIWGSSIPQTIIKQFTQETGIKVNCVEYDSNEIMFSKLKTLKKSNYDITMPSSYYIERMVKNNLLQPISKTKLPNFKHLNKFLLNKKFDHNNKYSTPYIWGATGILVNPQYIKNNISSWNNLWNPGYKNKIMILNDLREAFSMALLTLGYSVNDNNPQHIKEAYLKLKQLLPNIKIFSIDTVPNIYIDEDAYIGMIWNGDYKIAKEENSKLKYIFPKEGFAIWIDSLVILKDAPHPNNAHTFINFMMRPDIAKQVTSTIGYSTANQTAMKLLPKKLQNNPAINPKQNILNRSQFLRDLDDKTKELYEKYWEMLKIGS